MCLHMCGVVQHSIHTHICAHMHIVSHIYIHTYIALLLKTFNALLQVVSNVSIRRMSLKILLFFLVIISGDYVLGYIKLTFSTR